MHKKTFVCETHQEYGELGWRPQSNPNFDPLSGMAVAHDTLEHAPNTTDSIEDELQAFGAMIHVRGYHYFIRQGSYDPRPVYHMSGELAMLLEKVHFGELAAIPARKLTPCEDIQNDLIELVKMIRRELTFIDDALELTDAMARNLCAWITTGYLKARKRYANVDALTMFCEIEKRANDILKHANEGDQLTVIVSRGAVRVIHTEAYELER